MTWGRVLACGLLIAAAACAEPDFTMPIPTSATTVTPTPNPTPAPTPTPAAPSTADTFERTLNPGERAFHAFSVGVFGRVDVTLESLEGAGTLRVGLGRPAGTDCAVSTARVAAASADPFLSEIFEAGIYCLRVPDAGVVAAPVSFVIRIDRP